MKKIFLTMALAVGLMATAQVKIGTNVESIDANSLLELETTNLGLLFPRVELVSTDSYAPLLLDAMSIPPVVKQKGMTVYNTATTAGANGVTPGLYSNDGTNWVKLGGGTSSNLYTSDGTLTGARTVNQNNNDLTFTTGTAKTIVNGKFQTTGAIFTKFRVATSFGLVQADDYIIDFQISGAQNLTGVLPDPTTIPPGRVIILRNSSARASTGGTYTITLPDSGYITSAASVISSNLSMMLYCDGAKWVRICE